MELGCLYIFFKSIDIRISCEWWLIMVRSARRGPPFDGNWYGQKAEQKCFKFHTYYSVQPKFSLSANRNQEPDPRASTIANFGLETPKNCCQDARSSLNHGWSHTRIWHSGVQMGFYKPFKDIKAEYISIFLAFPSALFLEFGFRQIPCRRLLDVKEPVSHRGSGKVLDGVREHLL